MAQSRGHASYGLGAGGGGPYNSRGGGGGRHADFDENTNILDNIRQYTNKVEDFLDMYSEPVKP